MIILVCFIDNFFVVCHEILVFWIFTFYWCIYSNFCHYGNYFCHQLQTKIHFYSNIYLYNVYRLSQKMMWRTQINFLNELIHIHTHTHTYKKQQQLNPSVVPTSALSVLHYLTLLACPPSSHLQPTMMKRSTFFSLGRSSWTAHLKTRRHYYYPKCRELLTKLHSVKSQITW